MWAVDERKRRRTIQTDRVMIAFILSSFRIRANKLRTGELENAGTWGSEGPGGRGVIRRARQPKTSPYQLEHGRSAVGHPRCRCRLRKEVGSCVSKMPRIHVGSCHASHHTFGKGLCRQAWCSTFLRQGGGIDSRHQCQRIVHCHTTGHAFGDRHEMCTIRQTNVH